MSQTAPDGRELFSVARKEVLAIPLWSNFRMRSTIVSNKKCERHLSRCKKKHFFIGVVPLKMREGGRGLSSKVHRAAPILNLIAPESTERSPRYFIESNR